LGVYVGQRSHHAWYVTRVSRDTDTHKTDAVGYKPYSRCYVLYIYELSTNRLRLYVYIYKRDRA